MRVSGQGSAKRDKNLPRSTGRRGRGWDGPYREYVSIEGVEVDEEIDASVGQGGHAVGVILGGIDMVDPNGVCSKVSHQCCVTGTLL